MNKFQSVVVIRRLKKSALYRMRQNKPKEYNEALRTVARLRKIYEWVRQDEQPTFHTRN